MGIKTIKAISLIPDYNLWPRYGVDSLDSTNVSRMRKALRAGYELPHVIASNDNRIIDGFHRTRAILDVFGDDAKIKVEFREYQNEGEMLVDAALLNATQGLPMSPKDKAHFILKARKTKVPWPAIAEALKMDPEDVKQFIERRSATTQDGEKIALSYGAKNMAGKQLNTVQEHYVRTSNACVPEMYISMLLNALQAEGLIITPKTAKRLSDLRYQIDLTLEEVTA